MSDGTGGKRGVEAEREQLGPERYEALATEGAAMRTEMRSRSGWSSPFN